MRQERDEARESQSAAQQELEESRETLARDWSFSRFVGRTPVVRELEESVRKAADTDFPVRITSYNVCYTKLLRDYNT